MKRSHLIATSALVLAGTLGVAGIAAAADDGNGLGRGRGGAPSLTDEQKCEHQDLVRERAATLQHRLDQRQERLEERRAAADANGNAALVARIDRVLERLATAQTRLAERLATFETWVAEHC